MVTKIRIFVANVSIMKNEKVQKKTYDNFNYNDYVETNLLRESQTNYVNNPYSKRSEYVILKVIRDGISYKEFEQIRNRSKMTLLEWADFMNISERTLLRYAKNDENLDKVTSERVVEIAILQERGSQVLGSLENFNAWMNSEIRSLNNNKPKAFLDSSFGIQILKNTLGRIEHGIPS